MSVIKVALEITITLLFRRTITIYSKLTIELIPEAYSEHCQTSNMELFVEIVNGFKALIILAKSYI